MGFNLCLDSFRTSSDYSKIFFKELFSDFDSSFADTHAVIVSSRISLAQICCYLALALLFYSAFLDLPLF